MSKKNKKKDLKRIVRIQSRLTRNMIRRGIGSVMDDLNNIGNVSVDTRNLLLKFMEEFESSSSLPLPVESINLKSKKGKTKNKKYNKKKIKKYVRKQVKKEYNKIYYLLNDLFDDSSDDTNHQINGIVDLIKINGIEGMESFCKDVLNIPPEFILGPDYKKHMNNSSKNDCEESDKTEDDNKDDVTSKEIETDKKEDLESDKKDEESIKEEVTPMKHECIDDSRELY